MLSICLHTSLLHLSFVQLQGSCSPCRGRAPACPLPSWQPHPWRHGTPRCGQQLPAGKARATIHYWVPNQMCHTACSPIAHQPCREELLVTQAAAIGLPIMATVAPNACLPNQEAGVAAHDTETSQQHSKKAAATGMVLQLYAMPHLLLLACWEGRSYMLTQPDTFQRYVLACRWGGRCCRSC